MRSAKTRRAAETVIALSADRERMVGRVSSAEREIAELNGSVQRALTMASDAQLSSPPLSLTTASLLTQPKNRAPLDGRAHFCREPIDSGGKSCGGEPYARP